MKSKCIVFTVVFVLLSLYYGDLRAAPATAYQAEKVAKGWLKTAAHPLGTALGQQVKKVEIYTDNRKQPIYYIVYLQPNGFVIVSADDLIEPIIGFAEEGTYDPSPDNPLGALVTNDLNGRMESVRTSQRTRTKAFIDKSKKHQGKWGKFIGIADMSTQDIGTLGLSGIDDICVSPLIQTKWYQKTSCSSPALACYNYYTPGPPNGSGDGDPDNYWCGCVATALAQIMRYHQYPNTGIGTNSFDVKIRGATYSRQTRGGDGAGGAYSWADMVLEPGCSTTLTQRKAIGALCYDAGVGISNLVAGQYTWYDSGETDAYTHSAKVGLKSTFKYGNAVYGYNSGSNIGDGLIGMVNPDLDAGLPVCFGIHGSGNTGHEVVCDGYGYNAGTMYHHINMGWAGAYDAWYNLPTINSSPSYNSVYETIYNIYKLGSGEVISGRVTDPCGNPISNVNVNEHINSPFFIVTTHHTNSRGIYAFYGLSSDANFVVWADKTGYVFPGSTIVQTGHSADSQATSGNLWGVDIVCIAPDVNTMMPTSGPSGTYMRIQGTHFGSSSGTVIFPGTGYFGEILQWSDTLILCRVPFCPLSGDVVVQTSVGVSSAGVHFDITDPTIIYVDVNHTPDVENGTTNYPFSKIERGIYAATSQDSVIVRPGTYYENITLSNGRNITLSGANPNDPNIVASTIIDGNENGQAVVTLNNDCSTLTGFTITDGSNETGFGGGIFCSGQCEEASPTISHCIITRNSAAVVGGGICCSNSSPMIRYCIITGNSASSSGGGIACSNEQAWYYPTINHCIILGNSAYCGGGLYVSGGSTTISHSDISSNYAGNGGGIFSATNVNATISHTILWADTADDYGDEIFIMISGNPSVVTVEHSDVQGGLGGVDYPLANPPVWDANNIDADPKFIRDPNAGPDGYWDGVDDDYGDLHLSADSPCIDVGNPNYLPERNETDIDGQPRVVGCRVDIGADEFVYLGDIDFDGDIDFMDVADFAAHWQDVNCGKCGGADFTGDGSVDSKDLAKFAENWLKSLCQD